MQSCIYLLISLNLLFIPTGYLWLFCLTFFLCMCVCIQGNDCVFVLPCMCMCNCSYIYVNKHALAGGQLQVSTWMLFHRGLRSRPPFFIFSFFFKVGYLIGLSLMQQARLADQQAWYRLLSLLLQLWEYKSTGLEVCAGAQA